MKSFDQLPRAGDPELIVWSEQGLGDSIQFIRYLFLLRSADIPFLFVARDSLFSLLSQWTGLSSHIIRSTDLADVKETARISHCELADGFQYRSS